MKNIPSVDLSDFLSDTVSRKQHFVKEIGYAYEQIGFVALKNHLLDADLVSKLYKEVQHFFALDTAIKEKYIIEGLGGQRGYTAFGKEHAKGKSQGDLKEFWHFGQVSVKNSDIELTYPQNVAVAELPDFYTLGMQAFRALEKTGIYILRALALYIGIEETYFDPWVTYGNSILRPIYYPPITKAPKGAVRAAAHGDINLITLLMGASTGGLQILKNDGNWIDAIPEVDELVVNVGDMLEHLTNNKLKSTTHRVVNPPKSQWKEGRYSIPFFLHPRKAMPIHCIESCVTPDNPKQYEDITAGEFLHNRLQDIGLVSKD